MSRYWSELGPGRPIGEPWHVTSLLPSSLRSTQGGLLQALIRRRPGGEDVTVLVAYPNLALVITDGPMPDRKPRPFHRAHLSPDVTVTRPPLSRARDPAGLSIAGMEAENFAWIDFFWSTLGARGGRQRYRPGLRRPHQRGRPQRAVLQSRPQPGRQEPRTSLASTGRIGDHDGHHRERRTTWPAASGAARARPSAPSANPGCASISKGRSAAR